MNKLRMFFKVLLAVGFTNYRVIGNNVCETCQCCKNSICSNDECTAGCLDGYTGKTCQNKCPDNCESCDQYNVYICFQCKTGYYKDWRNDTWIGNCSLTCPHNCISCTANTSCSLCKDGYYNGENNNKSYSDCSLPCYSGCKACKSYDVCTECKDGYFRNSQADYSCQYNCSDGCIDNICNKEIGSCDCKTTYWGQNCSGKCRPECKTCENYDVCRECFNGFYGLFCEYNCSKGCIDILCNKDNGTCDCKSTYWGEYCEKACSKGCNSSECFNDTGKCMSGCEEGYTGDSCDTCINGFYGENCSSFCPAYCVRDKTCSNNCAKSIICNRLTGECDKGCEDNYWGRHCDKECSRNCKDLTGLSNCAQSNGHCLAGCYDGYFTEQCDKNCSIYCVNTSCDNTGKCVYGCTGDFVDDLCLQVKVEPRPGIAGIAATLGGSVGGAVVLVIILIGIAVVILKRRRNTKGYMDKNNLINDTVLYTAEDETVRQTDSDSAAAVYSMPLKKQKEQDQSNADNNPNYQNPSDPKKIDDFATICEKTVINDDLGVYHKMAPSSKLSQEDLTAASAKERSQEVLTPPSAARLSQEDLTPASATVLPLKNRTSQSETENVLQLEDPDENALPQDCLEKEFEKLPVGLIKPYAESQKSDNITKNRHRGVFPYDYNRVVLKDGESDYINASFIDGYKKLKTYIASLETKEIETNQSHTAQTSNGEKPSVAQKRSVNESISNVYEKIVRRADSREYSTLSYDTTQSQDVYLDVGFRAASHVVAENFQTIYEQPIIREDILEYSRLEHDTRQTPPGYSYDNEEKQQNQHSAFGTASAVRESEEHNYFNTDKVIELINT